MGESIMTQNYQEYRKEKALRYLDSLKHGYRISPPSLHLGITDKCFNTCVTCGHWKREKKHAINFEHYMSFLKMCCANGLDTVCYSGGDPLAYLGANLKKIMEWHIDNDVDFGFVTAGYLPDSVPVELLAHAKWVRVSLDGIGEEMYKITRGGVSYALVDESVKKMIKSGVNVELGITLHKHNYNSIDDFVAYAYSNDIKTLRFWLVRQRPDLSLDIDESSWLRKKLYLGVWQFKREIPNNNIDLVIDMLDGNEEAFEFEHCYACLLQLYIDTKGDIYPCCMAAGDSHDRPLAEPLGNICDDWDNVHYNIKRFNELSREELPEVCDSCTARLSSINYFVHKHLNEGDFI